MEDAFRDRVDSVYAARMKGKTKLKPSQFDRDALQLGVIYELQKHNNFAKALYITMKKLDKNPHCYDDVDDFGGIDVPAMNHVTWSGSPGVSRLG